MFTKIHFLFAILGLVMVQASAEDSSLKPAVHSRATQVIVAPGATVAATATVDTGAKPSVQARTVKYVAVPTSGYALESVPDTATKRGAGITKLAPAYRGETVAPPVPAVAAKPEIKAEKIEVAK
ncbi:MAG TPA: hypothetical protein VKX17_18435 [Planctomycetota bacterium]|nr:hypothetical protein [Planctomycetota bacterium]